MDERGQNIIKELLKKEHITANELAVIFNCSVKSFFPDEPFDDNREQPVSDVNL